MTDDQYLLVVDHWQAWLVKGSRKLHIHYRKSYSRAVDLLDRFVVKTVTLMCRAEDTQVSGLCSFMV